MRRIALCLLLALVCLSGHCQGSVDALDASKGLECAKIGGMVFRDDVEKFNPYSLKSRINEFELNTDGCMVGEIPVEFISVWATDLIIDRVKFLVSKNNKQDCFNYLVAEYGSPENVRDMYVWKTSTITLTFRMNPQRSAIRKKGQAIGVFWRTSDFEKTLNTL